MIPIVDLRSLLASFMENPAQFAGWLLAAIVVFAVAIAVYRKTPVRYRVPLSIAYLGALLLWMYWPVIWHEMV